MAEFTALTSIGALTAAVNTGSTAGGVDLDWNGSDEGDPVQGTCRADLHHAGHLEGEIAYDNGNDQTIFITEPWPFSAACQRNSQAATNGRFSVSA